MTESHERNSPTRNPIVLDWDVTTLELGKALEEVAKTATDAELAALVYAAGCQAIKIANATGESLRAGMAVDPRSAWSVGVAASVLGNELANRHGFDQDLMPAWAHTLNRLMRGEGA